MNPVLIAPKRSVGGIGPRFSVRDVGVRGAGHDTKTGFYGSSVPSSIRLHGGLQFIRLHRDRNAYGLGVRFYCASASVFLCTPSIIREEKDERIFHEIVVFQSRDDSANPLVHTVDHRRINLHPTFVPVLFLNGLPRLDAVVAICQCPV